MTVAVEKKVGKAPKTPKVAKVSKVTPDMPALADIEAMTGRLTKDVTKAVESGVSRDSARQLIHIYYTIQRQRIRFGSIDAQESMAGHPTATYRFFYGFFERGENMIKTCLHCYARNHPVGKWALSQYGVGPVLAAFFLAYFDIERAPSVGHFWRYAGLAAGQEWPRGEKPPWNPWVKSRCFLLGESFVKSAGYEDSFYGRIYRENKDYETAKNLKGLNADYIKVHMSKRNYSEDTDAIVWYSGCVTPEAAKAYLELPATKRSAGAIKEIAGAPGSGVPMLPPAHVHMRAKRYAVKMFIAHMHWVWFETQYQRPCPAPYAIAHMGHVHTIPPPNWPMTTK